MGVVVRHFDRIRSECNAHFMLIHHSGKNSAAGARGWSGVRVAVDTEIEVTDSVSGRCAEITKQRDLDSKGVRIGFRLDKISLGFTKWNYPATSCVVISTDAPRSTSKRLSKIGGAISEHLRYLGKPIKKTDLVKHFEGRHESYAVYRELKKLVESGQATDTNGFINVVPIGAN
jgi:putative DNA primase/helicase